MNNESQRNAVIAVARDVCNRSYGELNLDVYVRLVDAVAALDKPIGPPNRIIRESDSGPFCDDCGSSFKKKYFFWRYTGCIQPKCENYYG